MSLTRRATRQRVSRRAARRNKLGCRARNCARRKSRAASLLQRSSQPSTRAARGSLGALWFRARAPLVRRGSRRIAPASRKVDLFGSRHTKAQPAICDCNTSPTAVHRPREFSGREQERKRLCERRVCARSARELAKSGPRSHTWPTLAAASQTVRASARLRGATSGATQLDRLDSEREPSPSLWRHLTSRAPGAARECNVGRQL